MGNKAFGDPKGGEYEGETQRGRRHGEGTHRYPDGSVFFGRWKDNRRHGQGEFRTARGARYVGEFRAGRFHRGVAHDSNNCVSYSSENGGTFRGYKLNGMGVFNNPASGARYVGNFADGRFHGKGQRTNSSGTYSGMWSRGLRDGHGVFCWANGTRWEGEWRGGRPADQGYMRWPDGVCLRVPLDVVGAFAPDASRVDAGHAPFLQPGQQEQQEQEQGQQQAARSHDFQLATDGGRDLDMGGSGWYRRERLARQSSGRSGRRLLLHTLSAGCDNDDASGANNANNSASPCVAVLQSLPPPPAYTPADDNWIS